MPAISIEVAERLAGSLGDETAREMLQQAVADARGYREMVGRDRDCAVITAGIRRDAVSAAKTAARLAGEIVAAVRDGEEMPEDWHRIDAYAGCGEPWAEEVVRLVREELLTTGIRA
jgi:alkanesulfonate monooxygenase SsuD/methylene tetrahydromethanopterin reductase-like flavin-dependent oxidoreductase (luciferase family)